MSGSNIHLTGDDKGTPENSAAANNASAGQAASRAPAAISLKDAFSTLNITNHLSNEADEYVNAIVQAASKSEYHLEHKYIGIDNPQRADAYAFSTKEGLHTYILLFSETQNLSATSVPPSELIDAVVVKARAEGMNPLDVLVVTPDDYAKSAMMAAHILRVIEAYRSNIATDMTIVSLNGVRFRVNTSQQVGLDALNRWYPQASVPRADLCLTLEQAVPSQDPQQRESWDPVCTVTGYTEIIETMKFGYQTFGNQGPSLLPLVTITSLTSPIASPLFTALALPMAAEAWIRREGWKTPFLQFAKDTPNLASLIQAAEAIEPFTTPQEVEQFCATQLQPAKLAYDAARGRARIPMDDFLTTDQGAFIGYLEAAVCAQTGQFGQFVGQAFEKCMPSYIGVTEGAVDSRNIDFLFLTSQGMPAEKCSEMLYVPENPGKRGDQIGEVCCDKYTPLYTNNRCVLNPTLVNALASCISDNIQLQWGDLDISNMASGLGSMTPGYAGMSHLGSRMNAGYGGPSGNPIFGRY